MTHPHRIKSQRLLRKGALVQETYALFANWDDHETFDQNCDRVFASRFATLGWQREVHVTLRSRFRETARRLPLLILARNHLPLDEWTQCLHLTMALIDQVYWNFVCRWLFPEYISGRYRVRSGNVGEFVRAEWADGTGKTAPMSDYGITRTARDLVRMAHELGSLRGAGPSKDFSPALLTDRVFVFCCHVIADHEESTARVPASPLWQVFLMDNHAVESSLLRLHQFHKVHYETAGSLVQLSLPCRTAAEFAKRMAE